MSQFEKLEQNFEKLIIERCRFCGFDKYLEENPDFEFPRITPAAQEFIAVPGLFGGFTYFLEELGNGFVLYAEQSSRMDYSSDDYLYFEIAESGSRMLESEEQETAREKFRKLARKAHEEHLRRLREMKGSMRP